MQVESRSCGSGLVFSVLPCVSVTSVEPTPPRFLPGPSNVVQVTSPLTFSQFSGNGAAETAVAKPPVSSPVSATDTSAFRMTFSPPAPAARHPAGALTSVRRGRAPVRSQGARRRTNVRAALEGSVLPWPLVTRVQLTVIDPMPSVTQILWTPEHASTLLMAGGALTPLGGNQGRPQGAAAGAPGPGSTGATVRPVAPCDRTSIATPPTVQHESARVAC